MPVLANRVILITGGSSGIGFAILSALLHEGARVLAISRRHPSAWDCDASESIVHNSRLHWIHADLEYLPGAIQAVAAMQKELGITIDTIIQSAVMYGIEGRKSFVHTSASEWKRVHCVNFTAQCELIRAFIPQLVSLGRALLIGITSPAAKGPAPDRIPYASAKAASYSLFEGLAAELSGSGVAVVQVMPTCYVRTPGIRRRRPSGFAFEGYADPAIFQEPLVTIVSEYGASRNGMCVEIP